MSNNLKKTILFFAPIMFILWIVCISATDDPQHVDAIQNGEAEHHVTEEED